MTEPRPYRSGLGSSDAITIGGDPGPSTRQRALFEAAQLDLSEQDWTPNEHQTWHEWNINPAKHGPERLTRVPTFVKATSDYDELGRSAIEGYGLKVEEGRRRKGKEKATDEDVGDWYRALANRSAAGSGASTPKARPIQKPTVVDLTEDDDLDITVQPKLEPTTDLSGPSKDNSTVVSRTKVPDGPLRVHRSEWFIRRALLAQSRSSNTSATSSPGPSSISTMLNIETAQPRIAPAHYVLGPENKGYELLKTRHGWEGGGLGRPVDWEERQANLDTLAVNVPNSLPSGGTAIEIDGNGEPIVDLTIDSDVELEEEFLGEPGRIRQGGPGRTAPVATSLKLDRLGLGHQRNRKAALDAEKKVTHTIHEIRRVQQRSRYPPPKHGLELGKKGKMKWKERDKREREDRRNILAMLNS